MTLGGALFGTVTGYVLMKQYARFQTNGPWLHKLGRYLLGLVIALIFLVGLDLLFGLLAADETGLGFLLRYLRYATVTLWAFGARPGSLCACAWRNHTVERPHLTRPCGAISPAA